MPEEPRFCSLAILIQTPLFSFLNPWLLLGLSAAIIPLLIHLLNRRRYEVVDWGAMQFLQLSEVTRRRLFLEEVLLMLLRMSLIIVLVLALAGPYVTNSTIARLGGRANRDVVLVFDGSYSMGSTGSNGIPHEKAKEWARRFMAESMPGDSVAILQAKEQPIPVVPELSHDRAQLHRRINELPLPSGGCDWRPALQTAVGILTRSQRAEREIIVLSDGQRNGWADADSLFRWSLLASSLANVSLRVVNLASDRPADLPNWSLAPLQTNRLLAPVGRAITFRTAMELRGQKTYTPPSRVRLEVDGRFVRNIPVPSEASMRNGSVPLSFEQTFAAPGSHLVSVVLEPDPPAEERPARYKAKDELPGDNRQDFAIEVVTILPVSIVEDRASSRQRSERVDFLRQALEARDPAPVVQTRVVPIDKFDPSILSAPETNKQDVGDPAAFAVRPRVLILCDITQLTAVQQQAVARFLADGGGVLVTLGPHVLPDAYNVGLYRGGKGWLPARLDGIADDAAHPAAGVSDHPALSLFLAKPKDGQGPARFPQLGRIRFSHWWKLTTPSRSSAAVQVAALHSPSVGSPLLVEWIDPNRAGRLLQLAVPLDDSWSGELVRSESFVPLVHELVYYLAAARSAEFNVGPGQPLRYRLDSVSDIEQYTLQTPRGEIKRLTASFPRQAGQRGDENAILASIDRLPQGAMLRIDETRETGVYRLHTAADDTVYYVVQPKMAGESDLTPCSEEDRMKVAKLVPGLKYQNESDELAEEWISENHRQELWSWLLLGLIALLCCEVWLTRRLVKNR